MNIKEVIQLARRILADQENPILETQLLLSHVLHCDKSYLFSHDDVILSAYQEKTLHSLLERRVHGEPIAYILGQKEFWSLPLDVNNGVLIPRPETELLVEIVLKHFSHDRIKLLDLGTGSGAIALALASERPNWLIYARDISTAALEVAKANAIKLGYSQIKFSQGDWYADLENIHFDVIVSNPPYIAADDPHLEQGDLRFEPKTALIAEKNGLADLETIIDEARNYLKPGAFLIVEHGYQQAGAVAELLRAYGYTDICSYRDMADHERVSLGRSISPIYIE